MLLNLTIRRARNKTKRYQKSIDPTTYSRATGFETLIVGYFLRIQRLSKYLNILKLRHNDSMNKNSKNNYSKK